MSLIAIPNQPVNLVGSNIKGCVCDPLVPMTLIGAEDDLKVVFKAYACRLEENLIDNPFFFTGWRLGGTWQLAEDGACASATEFQSFLTYLFAFPSVGFRYELRIFFTYVDGTIRVQCGGWNTEITQAGMYVWTFEATNTTGLSIVALENSACCVSSGIQWYGANNTFIVNCYDQQGNLVFNTDYTNDPSFFLLEEEYVTLTMPINASVLSGCFRLEIEDCDNILRSQQYFQIIENTDCTLLVSACNDYDSLDFPASFRAELRVQGKVVRPKWEYDVSEERRSNGRHLRHYVDRQTKYDLFIDLQNEYAMPFVAALPVFDHVYIDQTEYIVDADEFEPIYDDVFDGTGGVQMTIRPKQELFRNVMCAEEGPGCTPKPIQLGQLQRSDLDVLLQTGDKIKLH